MRIRPATQDDLPAILPLFQDLDAKHRRSSKDIRDEIKPERYELLFNSTFKENSDLILSVVEKEQEVIGFALAKITQVQKNFILKDSLIGEVLYVAVSERYKRGGIGRELMKDMEQRLIEKGVEKFQLRVFSFNDETFPEKADYRPKYTVYEKYV